MFLSPVCMDSLPDAPLPKLEHHVSASHFGWLSLDFCGDLICSTSLMPTLLVFLNWSYFPEPSQLFYPHFSHSLYYSGFIQNSRTSRRCTCEEICCKELGYVLVGPAEQVWWEGRHQQRQAACGRGTFFLRETFAQPYLGVLRLLSQRSTDWVV